MAGPASTPLRLFARLLGIALATLLLVAAAGLWWAGQTTSFVRWALARAVAASDGRLEAGTARGTLAGGFGIESLRWRDGEREIELRDLTVTWRPDRLLRRELRLTRVEVGSANVRWRGTGEPPAPPASLTLPLDVGIDALGIGRLRLAPDGAEPIDLERVALAGRYRKGAYRIEHLSATSPKWGDASLRAALGDRAPYPLELSGSAGPSVEGWGPLPRITLLADGTLEDFALAAQAQAPAGTTGLADAQAPRPVWIGVDTRVRPFADSLSKRLAPIELTFDGVEPGQFGLADAPVARITGSATIHVGDDRISGRLGARNAIPGPANRRAIPVRTLDTAFGWSQQRLDLAGLRAELEGDGTVAGDGEIDFARRTSLFGRSLPAVDARLSLAGVDLSRLLSADDDPTLRSALRTRLKGAISADGATFGLELTDATRQGIAASARARIDGNELAIERAQLATGAGTVSARGSARLVAPWRVDLAGDFRELDPAGAYALRTLLGAPAARPRAAAGKGADAGATPGADSRSQQAQAWLERLRGRLSGSWAAQGTAWPDTQLRTRLVVDRGTLDGQPLRVNWQGEVSRERIGSAMLELSFADLQASASGSLGRAGDRLRFSLRAGSLARVDPRLGGAMSASGELVGGWDALGVIADVDGRRLRWAEVAQAGTLSGRIELPDLRSGRVALRAEATALQAGDRRIDRARLRADGDVDAHTLQLEADGAGLAGRASARGALLRADAGRWRWEGSVDELALAAPIRLALQAPARVAIEPGSVELGEAALTVDGAAVRLASLVLREGRIETRGEASGLPVARWAERFAGPQALAGVEQQLEDVRLGGDWDLAGSAPQSMSGRLRLRLDAGDTGESRGEADIAVDQGRLDGSVDARIPTLAFANRLIGPEWAVAGRLRFAGRVGGTVERPRLQGDLTGRDLALMQRALGWRLANGTLDARFDGDRLDLQRLRLESGAGSITMAGQLLLDGMHGGFTLRADRLPVPIGPGQRVVVSGDTGVASSGRTFEWKGDIRADEGLIELRGGDAPKLPDDVVIVDGGGAGAHGGAAANGATAKPATQAGGFQIGADLNLDLGGKLRVRGSGVDVVLAGALNLRGTLPSAPRAFGTVRVREGTYTAYGRRLDIARGQVVFNGPLDNPVLDIVAMRRNQAVEAGVALSGTVLSPRVRLVSVPDVPDSQKLSWLVLGVGLDDVRSGSQGAALQAAAATLFGSHDGGLSGGLSGALGLDILTVRGAGAGSAFDPNFGATFPGQASVAGAPAGTATQEVVAIGKRLSSRVFLTYEQGLRGVWNLLRIQYDITNRLSIRAQAGTDSAVDLLYFWSFD